MEQTSPIAIQIKKILNPMISVRLIKVNSWQEAKIDFNSLSFDDQQDILEAVQEAMDAEVKRQFERAQKLREQMRDTRQIAKASVRKL